MRLSSINRLKIEEMFIYDEKTSFQDYFHAFILLSKLVDKQFQSDKMKHRETPNFPETLFSIATNAKHVFKRY